MDFTALTSRVTQAFGRRNAADEAEDNTGAQEHLEKVATKGKKKKKRSPSKRNCFVLMIGDEGAILSHFSKGVLVKRAFAPSAEENHFRSLREWMESHPKLPVYLLCDLVDQSYVRHLLPPVSSLNINKLVNRRLNRDFAPEDIKGSLSLGREKDGRKEWVYLLISLANSTQLQQWIDPLLALQNRFAGLYLLPVETQSFLSHLDAVLSSDIEQEQQGWKILVLHNKVSGLRQIVQHKDHLSFTRLTQLSDDISAEVLAGSIEQEAQNTIEYLRRMAFGDDDGVSVFMVVSEELKSLVDPQKITATRVQLLTPFDVSTLLAMPQAALAVDRFSDVITSAYFALYHKPKLRLFTSKAKRLNVLHQAHLGLKCALALSVIWFSYQSLASAKRWWDLGSETAQAESAVSIAQRELADAEYSYSQLGDNTELVSNVATVFRRLSFPAFHPFTFIKGIRDAHMMGVKLDKWSWKELPAQTIDGQVFVPISIIFDAQFLQHDGDVALLKEQLAMFTSLLKIELPDFSVSRGQLRFERHNAPANPNFVIDLNVSEPEQVVTLQAGDDRVDFTLLFPKSASSQSQDSSAAMGEDEAW
jgi:hypothetical protein